MQQDSQQAPARRGFLDRKLTLRWTLILLLIVAVIGLVAWGRARISLHQCGVESREALQAEAENLARCWAVVGNKQIIARDYGTLQEYADKLVRSEPLAYIAVCDARNRAMVHTDSKYRGKKFTRSQDPGNLAEASVPVMDATSQVATVRVGVRAR